MFKAFSIFMVFIIPLQAGSWLVDGIHGWTAPMNINLWSAFPEHEFQELTPLDLPLQDILDQGNLTIDMDPIVITVPAGLEVLYFITDCGDPDMTLYPDFDLEGPDGHLYTNVFNGHLYLENPLPGDWIIYYQPYEDVYSQFTLATGPHFFSQELLTQFDGLLLMTDNTVQATEGHTLDFTEYELEQLNTFLNSGGSFLLIRQPEIIYTPGVENRQLDLLGLSFLDECVLTNELGEWELTLTDFDDNPVAVELTQDITQLQSFGTSAVTIQDLDHGFAIASGNAGSFCEDIYPPGTHPAVIAGWASGLGKFIGINDLDILGDALDNHVFVDNCLDWLSDNLTPDGDMNEDGSLDVLDIVIMVNIITGYTQPNPYQQWAGDMNNDGSINVLDVVLVVNSIISQTFGQ